MSSGTAGHRRASSALVLCYHAVGEWPHPLSVPAARLRAQLTAILRRGYRGVTLSAAVNEPSRGRQLVVTFDDGFGSVVHEALPVLQELGVPATVFVPTSYVTHRWVLTWPGFDAPRDAPPGFLRPMSWADVGVLLDAGWEVGSHTRTHVRLGQLDDRDLSEELVRSREECEQQVQRPCRSLAYPFGSTDLRVVAASRDAGYDSGVVVGAGRLGADPMRVPRIPVGGRDTAARFAVKTSRALQGPVVSSLVNQTLAAATRIGDLLPGTTDG